jgi:putative transposase
LCSDTTTAAHETARFGEEQIITILKEAEGGAKIAELCWRHRISDATFYTWRSKYEGLEVSEMGRLLALGHLPYYRVY